jgi:alpha-1,3/alpha-1,6-mannosyltransferase
VLSPQNYKQMSLYLVWPPFIFLLAKNLYGPRPLVGIALLAVSAIGTFVVCWLPFLVQPDPMTAAGHVIGRQFPFGRGLYEDKVANVWCSISLVLKLKQLLDPSTLIKLCVATTLASMLPSTVLLARRPNATNLMAASVCCALSFFLFSYQVHEKSILLPLLPAGLLFGHSPFATSWFITVGAFSMYPLLEKDGLTLAYVATVVGFNLLIAPSSCGGWRYFEKGRLLSLVGMIAIHAMAVLVPAPARYPDVHTYAFTVYSCAHFLGFYCYWLLIQWQAASLPESQVKAAASKNGLRIGFIHPDLGIGGAERLVVDAAVGLQKAGHSITMYTAHHDPGHSFEETHDGTLEVVVYGDWLPRSLCGTGKCMALCAYLRVFYVSVRVLLNYGPFGSPNGRYDALFVDQVSHSVPLLKAIGGESLKVVFYCHYPDYLLTPRLSCIKSLYRAPLDWAEEQSTGAADAILVNSEFTAQTFAQAFPSLHRRGIKPGVLYPAINLAQQELPSDAEKPDLSFGGAKHVVISINRYERKKNIGLAIMAVGALPQAQRKSLALVIAGGYDTRVTENVEVDLELKEMAEKHGVAEITHFMRNISNVEKLSLLQRATCLMYTPDREHFGIVPVEAMYAKCPVIAVNSGGPLESIDEGVTGFLRPQEPEAWAQATTKLLADPVAQKAMGEAGRKRAVAMFSLESFANCLDSQIRGLVQQQQAGREKTEPDQSQGPDGSAVGTAQSPVASRTRGARRRSTATGSK